MFFFSLQDNIKAMRSALLIIFFVTTNAYNPAKNTINYNFLHCRTLRGGPGQCVPLTKCQKITSQLATERSSISFVLQGDRCGSHFGQIYACCPLHEPLERKTATSEPYQFERDSFSAATTRRTTTRDYYDFESDRVFSSTTRRTDIRDFPKERTTARDFDKWTRNTLGDSYSAATTRTTVRYVEQDFRPTKSAPQNLERNKSGNSKSKLPESCGINISNRILGGETTEIDEFPWMALMQYRRPNGQITFDCSGALITARYVLTAAHCVNGSSMSANRMTLHRVRLGEWDLSTRNDCRGSICNGDALQDMEIENIIIHSDYKPNERVQDNDIALIRFKKEAKLNQFVQPICLPVDDSKNYEGKHLTVSGWGRTTNARGSASNVKLKVKVPVIERTKCSSFYEQFYGNMKLSKSQMCAGGERGRDSCQGDSGGPLMDSSISGSEVKWVAIGIVSSGPAACGVEGRPSVYTKVSDFMDWILNNIKN